MLKCRYSATSVYVLLLFTYYSCLRITPESFKVYKMSKLLSHDGLQEVHCAYVYTFGACDVHRRIITCPGLLNIVEKVDEYKGLSPWWRITVQKYKLQKWPKKPHNLNFCLVHNFSEEEPWCTYMLKHDVTVAASILNLEDLDRFNFSKVTTK